MGSSVNLQALVFSNAVDHTALCAAGLLLSVYALYVEMKKKQNPSYIAACDLNDKMSCSRVLTSEYSQGFGLVQYLVGKDSMLNLPNCILGMVFYIIQFMLSVTAEPWSAPLLYGSSIVSCLGSIYLAYILLLVLKDICVVCMATYLVNFALLYLNHQLFFRPIL